MAEPTGIGELKKKRKRKRPQATTPFTLILTQAKTCSDFFLRLSPRPGMGNLQVTSIFGNVYSNPCRERLVYIHR